ncbi:MAG: hypothetical protein PUB18_05595 [bacterium]|nr:hypothetical protein [bacterium]
MRKLVHLVVLLVIGGVCFLYRDGIVRTIVDTCFSPKGETIEIAYNDYFQEKEYAFVQTTDQFKPQNQQDLINIYYTILNSGVDQFTFYCPTSYATCLDDVNRISEDQTLLSSVNNFVAVYNGFQNIETEFDTLGRVQVSVTRNYTDYEIAELEKVVDQIIQENITDDMTMETKIKTIHDYIINHTVYDKNRSDKKVKKYQSDTAYGALIEHYAICGGYSDSMKLFLDRFGVENYKVASENHIWNLVKLDDEWLHLDLTWDDPITNTGQDVLEYDYFLITTEELFALNTDQHFFDTTIYMEAK